MGICPPALQSGGRCYLVSHFGYCIPIASPFYTCLAPRVISSCHSSCLHHARILNLPQKRICDLVRARRFSGKCHQKYREELGTQSFRSYNISTMFTDKTYTLSTIWVYWARRDLSPSLHIEVRVMTVKKGKVKGRSSDIHRGQGIITFLMISKMKIHYTCWKWHGNM